MTRPPWQDEFTLLCERCGYVIEGLPRDGHCPECGKPIAESLPEARTGTAWQRRRGFKDVLFNAWEMLTRPREAFAQMRMDQSGGFELQLLNTLIAGVIFGGVVAAGMATYLGTKLEAILWTTLFTVTCSSPVVSLAYLALTVIERTGIRFFARRRGWRVTSPVSRNITAHASVGWIACSALAAVSVPVSMVGEKIHGHSLGLGGLSRVGTLIWHWSTPTFFLLGLLWFEWLVYTGVRQCKFANRLRPEPQRAPEPPSATIP